MISIVFENNDLIFRHTRDLPACAKTIFVLSHELHAFKERVILMIYFMNEKNNNKKLPKRRNFKCYMLKCMCLTKEIIITSPNTENFYFTLFLLQGLGN